ncbi:MAG: TetR/AcrR family transcriptional regulator [Candidatus Hydrogenedentes bacterium]|nr:TetR/AcrR family transcriptional regulator [Candidatus Hydrogenedentota bacterium]
MITGKQRELQQRDELFLRVAQDLLLEDGYHGLTMARVADMTRFSKGTVYNRFSCKEEIVVELGSQCRELRYTMLERAAHYHGRPRERMVALGEAAEHFERLYPEKMRVLSIIDAEAILEKVPEELRKHIKSFEIRAFNLAVGVVHDAIAEGDLVLPARSSAPELSFALWCVFDSGAASLISGFPYSETGMDDPYGAIARGCHLLMDGAGWRPLTAEWDYSATARHIRDTLFAEEARLLSELEAQQRAGQRELSA